MDSQSLVNNISDTIQRTRQIMQESKAITIKNQQRKNMLEEKFSFNDLKIEKDFQTDDIIRRISELEIPSIKDSPQRFIEDSQKIEAMQTEICELNKKVKIQASKIESLEKKLNEINSEKILLVQELNALKNDAKLENSEAKNEEKKVDAEKVEEKISILEEKYKEQVLENHKLIEEIRVIQGQSGLNSSKKIMDLENLLMSSLKKYKGLKNRLEKTENLITLEKSTFSSPKNSTLKKFGSPKCAVKKKIKSKVSSYKSLS